MATQYFVRIQGLIRGPYDLDQLRLMSARGQLRQFHEVSEDRAHWYPAAQCPALFPPAEKKPGSADRAEKASNSKSASSAEDEDYRSPRSRREAGSSSTRNLVVGLILLVLIGGGGVGIWLAARNPSKSVSQADYAIQDVNEEDLTKSIALVATGIDVLDSDGEQRVERLGHGSGFAVSPDGYFLTNEHVVTKVANLRRSPLLKKISRDELVELTPTVWIILNRVRHPAQIVYISDRYDFAVLKIDAKTPRFFQLASSEKIPRTTRVIACGFPGVAGSPLSDEEELRKLAQRQKAKSQFRKIEDHYQARDLVFSSSMGSVSRMEVEEGGRVWIQHDTSINPGNSGGPLLTTQGIAIGINTRGVQGSGVYWALALNQLRPEIDRHVPNVKWD